MNHKIRITEEEYESIAGTEEPRVTENYDIWDNAWKKWQCYIYLLYV